MSLRNFSFSLTMLNQSAFEAPGHHCLNPPNCMEQRKTRLSPLLPFTFSSKNLILALVLESSGIVPVLRICIYMYLNETCRVSIQHTSNSLLLKMSVISCDSTRQILCVHLPFVLLFHSCGSLDPSSFPSSRECVRMCVCHQQVSLSRGSG